MKLFGIAALLIASLIGLGAAGTVIMPQQEQEDSFPIDKKKFMQRKVEDSKNIVQALATENYDAIKKYSQDLLLLSNESNWNSIQSPEYIELSREFRLSASRLREIADQKNIDSATLGYFELTLNCVRCHKYLRSNSLKK